MRRTPYPTDITDAHWAVLGPEIPAPRPGGRPRKTDIREVVDAIFYITHEGCTWRALPPLIVTEPTPGIFSMSRFRTLSA